MSHQVKTFNLNLTAEQQITVHEGFTPLGAETDGTSVQLFGLDHTDNAEQRLKVYLVPGDTNLPDGVAQYVDSVETSSGTRHVFTGSSFSEETPQ